VTGNPRALLAITLIRLIRLAAWLARQTRPTRYLARRLLLMFGRHA
jgi:hypothetical protein